MAFGFESIEDSETRAELLQVFVEWLLGNCDTDESAFRFRVFHHEIR